MNKLLKFAILLFGIILGFEASAQDIYVATNGNDNNLGTKEKPVATLEAARDLIRNYKSIQDLPKGGITVWIGEGQYDQEQAFALNENDSGEPDAPIIWRPMPNEKVSITGGKSIPSEKFEKVTNKEILKRLSKNAAQNVMQVNLKEFGIHDYGQIKQYGHALSVSPAPIEIFFNNEAMTLAQYPNKGYIKIGKIIDAGSVPRIQDYSNRGAIFEYTDQRHAVWAGQKDVWLQGSFNYGFSDDNILIESIDTKSKQIKLATPSLYGVASGKDYQHYIARNILDELDVPCEWYMDRNSGILYFWPPGNMDNSTIMVSILEDPIISLEGASYITIRDLTIESGRGIGVYLERGSNNLIAGCTIRNVGTTGVFMGQGAKQTFPGITHDDYNGVPISRRVGNMQGHMYKYTGWNRNAGKNHGILSCDIYNTGSGGVSLSGGSKRQLIPGNNYVENCKIHDYNRRNKFLWSAINVDGCGNRISHNEIYNSEWQGIFVRGNEHLFEYNNVHHVTTNSDDTSPWYIGRDPSDRGNIIRYNYFHHIGSTERMNMGIYCDDGTTDVLIFGNVFYKMHTSHGQLFSNSGWELRLINNIIIEPMSQTVEVSAHLYSWAKNEAVFMFGEEGLLRKRLTKSVNIYESPYAEKYPELMEYLDPIVAGKEWQGMRARGNVIAKNVILADAKKPLLILRGNYAQCDTINNFKTENDPGFVDYKNENFNLLPNSEVFKQIPDFEVLPFDKMGLYIDIYRKQI